MGKPIKLDMTIKTRHKLVLNVLVKTILRGVLTLLHGPVRFKKEKLEADRTQVVLCNHQGFWDPVYLNMMFDKPIHFMATDNLFSVGFISKALVWLACPIPKKKQGADLQAMRCCMNVAKQSGAVGIFPEGSRSWDGRTNVIDSGIVPLIRAMKADVVLCRLRGVYGTDPRWGKHKRRGAISEEVYERISAEQCLELSDEQLMDKILTALTITDAPSEQRFKSRRRAEGIESLVYVCPRCKAMNSIGSKGAKFFCSECGLEGEYTEHLSLKLSDESLGITALAQLTDMQKTFVRSFEPTDGRDIFNDCEVKLVKTNRAAGTREDCGVGTLRLTPQGLFFSSSLGEQNFSLGVIRIVSPMSGKKLLLTAASGDSYMFIGKPGFGAYKYTQMLNHLRGMDEREVI